TRTLAMNGDPKTSTRRAGKTSAGAGIEQPERGIARFLLAVAYPLRLVQATHDANGEWMVRLSPLGRWVVFVSEAPPAPPVFPQTVLVQPNLEIVAYRQGLTPELIIRLAKFASWKSLGAACTLQLESHSVYRALEQGETFESIVQALERHGM